MKAFDYATIIVKLESEIARKIEEFERTCCDLKASDDATMQARVRRLQLIAVRDFINIKTPTL